MNGTDPLRFHVSEFVGNEAPLGGGLHIKFKYIKHLEFARTNHILLQINNCSFLKNKAFLSGGGIHLESNIADIYPRSNKGYIKVTIWSTSFVQHTGGTIFVENFFIDTSDKLLIDECKFSQNNGKNGAAIQSEVKYRGHISLVRNN